MKTNSMAGLKMPASRHGHLLHAGIVINHQ
jgi:hypothetical protein